MLEVLRSLGIADLAGGVWSLTQAWARSWQVSRQRISRGYLETPPIRARSSRILLTGGDDYWQLSMQDRLTVARGVSFNPASPFMPSMLRRDLGMLDSVVESLEAGGQVWNSAAVSVHG